MFEVMLGRLMNAGLLSQARELAALFEHNSIDLVIVLVCRFTLHIVHVMRSTCVRIIMYGCCMWCCSDLYSVESDDTYSG